jgi:RNase P subunit RPR2
MSDRAITIQHMIAAWNKAASDGGVTEDMMGAALDVARANSSDVSVPGEHHCHVCEGCGHIWWHQKTEWTRAERDAAHSCPKCGCGPYRTAFSTMREALESRKQLREADEAMLSAAPQAEGEGDG